MKMNMFVTTQSGSRYIFKMENGTLVFRYGTDEGVVVKMENALKIGSTISMDCKKKNLYGQEDVEITHYNSAQIVEMTVSVQE